MTGDRSEELYIIKGTVPSLSNVPKGCRFAPRCQFADEKCISTSPVLKTEKGSHKVKCWHYKEIAEKEDLSNMSQPTS